MQSDLDTIIKMLLVIHQENMGLMKMLCGKKADDVINAYAKMLENAMTGDCFELDVEKDNLKQWF